MPRRKSSPEGLFEGTSGGRFFFKVFLDQFFQIELPVDRILGQEGGFWQNRTQDVEREIIFFEVSTTDTGLKKIKALGIAQISPEEFARAETKHDEMQKKIHASFEDLIKEADEAGKQASQQERAKKLKDVADQHLGFDPRTKFDDFLEDFNTNRGI